MKDEKPITSVKAFKIGDVVLDHTQNENLFKIVGIVEGGLICKKVTDTSHEELIGYKGQLFLVRKTEIENGLVYKE